MKTICLTAFLVLSGFAINAQSLIQSINEPSIGDIDKNYRLDTSAYISGLPNNITGSAVTWDYTQVVGTFPLLFDSVIAPALAPSYTDFPQASYVIRRGTLNTFYKSSTVPSQTELLGFYSPTLSITFTNTAMLLQYPVSYGYSYSDVVSGFYKTGTNTGAVNGNIAVVADGLGTLNLPNNVTFQNVLRVKSVETVTLSASLLPLGTIKQTIFSYFAPGKKYPVIYVQYNTYQLLAGAPIITIEVSGDVEYFYVAGLDHVQDPLQHLQVAPNPFRETIHIVGAEDTRQLYYRVLGLDGRVLLEQTNLDNLNTSDLSSGIYVLEISKGKARCYKKIIKE